MKSYYLYVCVVLAVSGCGGHTTTAAITPQQQLSAGSTDYSYIYTEMANSGSCRNNMTLGGGLSAKCAQ